jgi:mannosyltransferase
MTSKKITLWAIALFALNTLFKGLFLSSNAIGWDEPFSIYHAQLDVSQICRILATGNNPPLYELFLHFWIDLFGIGEFAVRFPSLIFSSVTAVVLFLIGQKFFNHRIGITAGLIFIFSNYHIFFAHEARVYALFGMLTALSIYLFLSLSIKEKISVKNLLPLLVVNAVLIYSHYFGFVILILQTFFVFSSQNLRQKLSKSYLIYTLVIIVIYLPNIKVLISRFMESTSKGTWVKAPNDLESLYEMFRQFTNAPVVAVASLVLIISSLTLLILKRKNIQITFPAKLITISFFVPYLAFFVISYWVPMFIDRYLIFTTIPLILLLAICADSIFSATKFRFALHAIVLILFAVSSKPNLDNKRHVDDAVAKIKELKTEHSLVIFCPESFIFNYAYYEDKKTFTEIDPTDPYKKLRESLKNRKIIGINHASELLSFDSEHLIYLDAGADFSFPENGIVNYLEANYTWEASFEFPEIYKVHSFRK